MRSEFKRGDVYLVREDNPQGGEIKKTRPWVLVGADPLNRARSTVIAIPLSTQAKEIPGLSVKVYHNGVSSCVVIDQLRALDKRRFIQHEGTLNSHELSMIEEGLKQILCL